jgi:uncharacterized OB-fold protein
MSESLVEAAKQAIAKESLPIILEAKTKTPLYISARELTLRFQLGVLKVQKFFEGLKAGKVYMTQCIKCGEKFFPPKTQCPKCLESNIEWTPLSGEGELLTCTKVYVKPATFAHYGDYMIGIAQMKEGVRVLAWLKVDDPQKVKPRMKIRLVTTKREPEGFITYELIPAE